MKRIACVITEMPEDSFWLPISIKSYIDWIDHVIIVDGSHFDACSNAVSVLNEHDIDRSKITLVRSEYPHEDKGADGKQRNKYLEVLKEKFNDDLAIVVDSDEVLADNAKEQIDVIIKNIKEKNADIFNPRMEHFIDNFAWVDATQDYHFCPCRIFKVAQDLYYPEVEHVLLKSDKRNLHLLQTINMGSPVFYYHYGYTKGKENIIKKFNKHMIKSNCHTPEFLEMWKNAHLSGTYPRRSFMGHHPKIVREVFKLE